MTAQKSPEGAPATLSTRFTEDELVSLRKAAEIRQWSVSQLIRIGACEKALHIVNSTGDAEDPVRMLLAKVVRQLEHPRIKVVIHTHGPEADPVKDLDEVDQIMCEDGDCGLYVARLPEEDEFLLLMVIEKLGAELAPILRQEWKRAKTDPTQTYTRKLLEQFASGAPPFDPAVQQLDSNPMKSAPGGPIDKRGAQRQEKKTSKKTERKVRPQKSE